MAMMGIAINMTLTNFSKVVDQVTSLKKPITDGADIPKSITWKETFVSRMIKESWNGLALTNFVFCAS